MRRKLMLSLLAIFMPFMLFEVHAEDYSDREYWDAHCDGVQSEECDAYRAYLLEENRNTLEDLENALDNLEEKYDEAVQLANEAKAQIDSLAVQIAALNIEIADLEAQINVLQEDIEKNEVLVEELNQRVLERMRDAQETMHFNTYLDFLLGSSSFEDLMRRSYGIEAIMSKDEEDRQELIEVIEQLDSDKQKLDESRSSLDSKRTELENSQAYYYQIEEKYQELAEGIQVQIEEVQNEIDNVRQNYSDILDQIGDISNIP